MSTEQIESPTAGAVAYGRQLKGWSQQRLANELLHATGDSTWTRDRVARYENGRSEPGPRHIAALHAVLGLSYEFLVTGQPQDGDYRPPDLLKDIIGRAFRLVPKDSETPNRWSMAPSRDLPATTLAKAA